MKLRVQRTALWRGSLIALFGLLLSTWSTTGKAALSDQICSPSKRQAGSSYPTSEDLRRAASLAEERLARTRGTSDPLLDVLALLEVPAPASQPPAADAVADYCVAAGEVMRVSSKGSQFQAQTYLLEAFQKAQAGDLAPTASRAAYRLGLVSLAGPTVAGARGARNSRGGTNAAVEEAKSADRPSENSCATLLDPNLLTRTNLYISLVSLECSAERALRSGDYPTSALASLRLARLGLAVAESNPQSGETFRKLSLEKALAAVPVAAQVPNAGLRAELLGRLVSTVLDLDSSGAGKLTPAVAAVRQALPDDLASIAMAAALDARIALALGNQQQARSLLGEALLQESQRTLPARLPEFYLLLAQADPERRDAHVLAAYRALESIRPLLPRFDPITEESAFALYMRRVFENAVDVQLASAGTSDEPARIMAAQQIVETYRQAELENAFGSECLPPRDPVKPENLAANEVLLYPILLPDRVELLYVTGGGKDGAGDARFRRLPANRTADRQKVSRLVEALVLSMSYGDDEEWRGPSKELYDILIKPVEANLMPGAMLAIIPDGPLRALPFAALLDGKGRFLVEKTQLSVAPSLTYSQPGSHEDGDELTVVAASLQREVELAAGYFPKLEGTAAEARIAAGANVGGADEAKVIEDFQKTDLVRALSERSVDVLHLATHASFNGRSDRAFIVANGEIIPLSELRQLIAQNRTRGDELDLLVLSACETAVGDDEASMGLAGAAVQAGATSAIASLWQVNDAGTAELMKQFYARFREGGSKAGALRDAQLALIGSGSVNANPNIWAAFTLLGAWR